MDTSITKRPNTSEVIDLMKQLTDEQRLEVMGEFCKHCGGDSPGCYCWNDE